MNVVKYNFKVLGDGSQMHEDALLNKICIKYLQVMLLFARVFGVPLEEREWKE